MTYYRPNTDSPNGAKVIFGGLKIKIDGVMASRNTFFKSFSHDHPFLDKYGESESISWEELAKDDIAKYGKPAIALRGARYREGFSQKELAKRTGITQDNISKMENGKRPIGEKVAKKLAKALNIDFELLIDAA